MMKALVFDGPQQIQWTDVPLPQLQDPRDAIVRVDAATIVVNGSLRLNDGPTLELGSEIAISTSRLHARGPITLAALVNYCWVVEANGRLREAS